MKKEEEREGGQEGRREGTENKKDENGKREARMGKGGRNLGGREGEYEKVTNQQFIMGKS